MALSVAFLWHLHQPSYRDPLSGRWILPWVRLHALKDYYDMVAILGEVPGTELNFNFSPSLLSQLAAYSKGEVIEVFAEIAYKPASLLSEEERTFLLQEGFQAHPQTLIEPHSRYRELFLKRGRRMEGETGDVLARFGEQDLRDLQVWSQLAWFDPWTASQDPELLALLQKERGYTEEDKTLLQTKEREWLQRTLPAFREALEKDQIEITVSPYYHPILPLLVDSDSAREGLPSGNQPPRFRHPEDAEWQLNRAVAAMEEEFGRKPKGLWPSEGAVSEAILPLVSRAGFEWLATDESILRHSLRDSSRQFRQEDLYMPWVAGSETEVAILFRDKTLSDAIGFEYSHWSAQEAAKDFVGRLQEIQKKITGDTLVLVALDGENAWEYYPGDGREFLMALYGRLASKGIRTVKISDYLRLQKRNGSVRTVAKLHPGSWIQHDFSTWIGSGAHQKAWSLLGEAHEVIFKTDCGENDAREAIYAAEGSDWFWWYSGRHSSSHLTEFDLLFRNHLIRAYQAIQLPVPSKLYGPIIQHDAAGRPAHEPSEPIHPVLDGKITDYYEWHGAGRYDFRHGGAMPFPRGLLHELLYGVNEEHVYLAIIMARLSPEDKEKLSITLEKIDPIPGKITLIKNGSIVKPCIGTISNIIELAIPIHALKEEASSFIKFFLLLELGDGEVERYPQNPIAICPVKRTGETQWSA